ncbi:hypothetical protein K3554_07395 [Jannaschia sp. W003]|nr:hypothetical protein [Jannaschia sp. W003]UWQ23008.1 hypothetical protein K3554_07395 [Jannaschia sp. W003]
MAACAAAAPPPPEAAIEVTLFRPEYRGVETALLAPDLVRLRVAMAGARDLADLRAYADCAAAQYALIRGFRYARHVRTAPSGEGERGGVRRADAVYTVSPDLPRGLRTIEAEDRVAECRRRGIPTV